MSNRQRNPRNRAYYASFLTVSNMNPIQRYAFLKIRFAVDFRERPARIEFILKLSKKLTMEQKRSPPDSFRKHDASAYPFLSPQVMINACHKLTPA